MVESIRNVTLSALLVGATSIATVANDQVPGEPQQAPVMLRGGDLYTVSHGLLPATDLLFEDGRIRAIGKDLPMPPGGRAVEVHGQRVYPGLIAPQTTLGLIEIGAVRATRDAVEVGSITPEVAAHVAYNPDSEVIPTVRSHGITTAQVVPRGGLIAGRGFLTRLDGWTKEDAGLRLIDGLQIEWPQARLDWTKKKPSLEDQREAISERRRELERAVELARSYRAARATDSKLPIDSRWEAMGPYLAGEQKVFIRADDYRQIVQAVEFAERYGLDPVLVGGKESYKLTGYLRERGVPVIAGSIHSLPMREDDDYDAVFSLPLKLHEAGVTFCIAHLPWGAWDVRNLPLQAGQAVAFGLPRDVALRSITLSTAEILGIEERQGSLEVGKDATLFVSRGDVLDTIGQQVTHMFIDGRRVDLQDRHKELYRKYRAKP